MPHEKRLPPVHPGEILLEEFLKPLALTQTELAERLGVSYPRVNELVHGKRDMTPDTALRLERLLGRPIDQTEGPALAQIQVVARKINEPQ